MAIRALIFENHILTEASDEARLLFDKGAYGTLQKNGQVQMSLIEGLYLHDCEKIQVLKGKRPYTFEELIKYTKKFEKQIRTKYAVYKDLRDRGYTVKTALKFGADFRVYEKGVKPGEDHSKWVVYPVPESETLTWHEFSAKNRVAHSTKKRLLMGVVDDEGSVTYFEVNWLRP